MTKQLFNDSHIHINAGQVLLIANPNLDISPYSRVRVVIGLPNLAGLHLAFELDIMQGSGVLYQLDSFALAAAGKFNRMVMQGNQHVAPAGIGQQRFQALELALGHCAVGLAGHHAVQEDQPPALEVGVPADLEWAAAQLVMHGRQIVMVARHAVHRLTQGAELLPDVGIPARLVVHQVAGQQDHVGSSVLAPRRGERRLERGQRGDAAQLTVRGPVQVQIGELDDAEGRLSHGFV